MLMYYIGHEVSKVAPSSMTSDSVILEDGTRLSRAIVEQLKRLLAAARENIQIPLTPVETYQREARSVFLRKCITDKVYIELFNSKACLLLVLVLTYPLDNRVILRVKTSVLRKSGPIKWVLGVRLSLIGKKRHFRDFYM